MDTKTAITRAIELLGGPVKAASRLNARSYQTVQQWVEAGRIPAKYGPRVERETRGEIVCEQVCPEVDWGFVRKAARRRRTAKAA